MSESTPHRRSQPSLKRPSLSTQSSAAISQVPAKLSVIQPNPGRVHASFDDPPRPALKQVHSHGANSVASQRIMAPIITSQKCLTADNLMVGDLVDVPGGMYGTIKFIGEVKGKKGVFAGVELSREWAARGKNNGDVEGANSTRYFTTSIPGAGIFLPSDKAYKRASPTDSSDSFPPTPTTPSAVPFNPSSQVEANSQTPPTPLPAKFARSIGPGRAASPALKPKSRPSLPRPESPLRKTQNVLSTPSGRPSIGAPKFSKSTAATPRYAPSPSPGKFGGSVRGIAGDPGKRPKLHSVTSGSATVRAPKTGRSESRTQSRLGPESMFDEDADSAAVGLARPLNGAARLQPKLRPLSGQEEDVRTLKSQLAERDKQLEEQSTSLAEMEKSVAQLQTTIPQQRPDLITRSSRASASEEADLAHLRSLVREKNDKIALLTADFDAHRADFRSTIDTLELASTETERVYERKVEELTQEIRELQDRGEDMESVAQQLKQLEELVQELEEGLEDARRGEAEARGEVEFLRGEVERGRSELKRERDKAAAALKGAGAAVENGSQSREVEQRDDEIRGLKAIIHSLSRDAPDTGSPKSGSRRVSRQRNSALNQADGANDDQLAEERKQRERLERDVQELEGLVDRKTYREEELEHEIERLRAAQQTQQAPPTSNGHMSPPHETNRISGRIGQEAMAKWHQIENQRDDQKHIQPPDDSHSTITDASNLWCEICETSGHDILTCTSKDAVKEGLKGLAISSSSPTSTNNNNNNNNDVDRPAPLSPSSAKARSAAVTPRALPMPNPMEMDMVAGKASGVVDREKWCALCERDGHESVDCPFDEDY
ncbi:MAG: hypothetical protein Q9213_005936 [Squamulea squamosa]